MRTPIPGRTRYSTWLARSLSVSGISGANGSPAFSEVMLVSGTDSASPIDSLGTRAERYAALVANTNIAAAAAIGIHRLGRDISRDADANRGGRSASENSRRAGRDTRAG